MSLMSQENKDSVSKGKERKGYSLVTNWFISKCYIISVKFILLNLKE